MADSIPNLHLTYEGLTLLQVSSMYICISYPIFSIATKCHLYNFRYHGVPVLPFSTYYYHS